MDSCDSVRNFTLLIGVINQSTHRIFSTSTTVGWYSWTYHLFGLGTFHRCSGWYTYCAHCIDNLKRRLATPFRTEGHGVDYFMVFWCLASYFSLIFWDTWIIQHFSTWSKCPFSRRKELVGWSNFSSAEMCDDILNCSLWPDLRSCSFVRRN